MANPVRRKDIVVVAFIVHELIYNGESYGLFVRFLRREFLSCDKSVPHDGKHVSIHYRRQTKESAPYEIHWDVVTIVSHKACAVNNLSICSEISTQGVCKARSPHMLLSHWLIRFSAPRTKKRKV